MIYLSQRNPAWSKVFVGKTKRTIGQIGCTISCVSMLSDYFGCYVSPDVIARKAKFTLDGLLIWSSLASIIKGMRFVERVYRRNNVKINDSLTDPNKAVILQVDYGSHWVVALRDPKFSEDYLCLDPLKGKTCLAIGDYRNITGSAHFMKT